MRHSPLTLAGNWKMHLGPREAEAFISALRHVPGGSDDLRGAGVHCVLFPPAVSLDALRRAIDAVPEHDAGRQIDLGVQQIHPAPSGAYTGETSGEIASQAGATYALVGHSERRHIFGETDADTLSRVLASFRAGLSPVLCVGETLEQRQAGELEAVLRRQLEGVFSDPEVREQVGRRGMLVAYEPVWAIGTGETATPQDAGDAHQRIRAYLVSTLGTEVGRSISILYGGSVKPELAEALLHAPEVGGLLVGGASLAPASWGQLMRVARDVALARTAD